MGDTHRLSEFEQLVLLAVVRLDEDAYGVTVCREIESVSGRSPSVTATYAALERMEQWRLVDSWVGEATPVRGGRAKKHFRIRPEGARALHNARAEMERMWEGLDAHPDLEVP
jgi:PadR family transcriptional regulator PadR